MKKSLLMLLIAFGVFLGCGILGRAQEQRKPIMLGGYREIATDDAEAQAAAEFAVGAQGEKQETTIKLVSIEKAESQVVAGTNYRLCLKVEVTDKDNNETTQEVKVVVFKHLPVHQPPVYELTSWNEEECGESKGDDK
jgi:hypothetical protein